MSKRKQSRIKGSKTALTDVNYHITDRRNYTGNELEAAHAAAYKKENPGASDQECAQAGFHRVKMLDEQAAGHSCSAAAREHLLTQKQKQNSGTVIA